MRLGRIKLQAWNLDSREGFPIERFSFPFSLCCRGMGLEREFPLGAPSLLGPWCFGSGCTLFTALFSAVPSFLKPQECPLHHGSRDRTMLSKPSPPSFCRKCIQEHQHHQLPHLSFWENWKSFNFFYGFVPSSVSGPWLMGSSWDMGLSQGFPNELPSPAEITEVCGRVSAQVSVSQQACNRPGRACKMESSVPVIVTQHRRAWDFHCGLAGKWWKKPALWKSFRELKQMAPGPFYFKYLSKSLL